MGVFASYLTLVPAYGRDYKSKAAAVADLTAGKDFRCEPQGCYGSLQDFPVGMKLEIRYNKLRSVTIVTVTEALKKGVA